MPARAAGHRLLANELSDRLPRMAMKKDSVNTKKAVPSTTAGRASGRAPRPPLLVLLAILAGLVLPFVVSRAIFNSFPTEDLIALPAGVEARCSHFGCDRKATRALASVVAELQRTGVHGYMGTFSGAFCDLHAPTNSEVHEDAMLFLGFAIILGEIAIVVMVGKARTRRQSVQH